MLTDIVCLDSSPSVNAVFEHTETQDSFTSACFTPSHLHTGIESSHQLLSRSSKKRLPQPHLGFSNTIALNSTTSLRPFTTTTPHHSRAWRAGRKLTFRKQTLQSQRLANAKPDPTLYFRKAGKTYTRATSPLINKHPVLDPRDKHGDREPYLTHLNASGEARMVRLPPTSEKPATSRTATATSIVVFSNPYPYRLIAKPLRAPTRAGDSASAKQVGSEKRDQGGRKSIEMLEAELWNARQDAAVNEDGVTPSEVMIFNDAAASMSSISSSRLDKPSSHQTVSASKPADTAEGQSAYHTEARNLKKLGIPRPKGKGDVLAVARIAGIQAAKETSRLIPLCHNISLAGVDVDIKVLHPTAPSAGGDTDSSQNQPHYPYGALSIAAIVTTHGQTGVEMEALVAASIAGLTVYDMCKAVDRGMKIERVRVTEKRGGRSGDWVLDETGALRVIEE